MAEIFHEHWTCSSITHLCDGEILLQMMRFVLILNNQPCPTPFVAVVFSFWSSQLHWPLTGSSPGSSGLHFGTSWRWRTGRPRQSWLRTIENDLRPLNFGLVTAKRHAQDWVGTAATRDNGHDDDKLLNDDIRNSLAYSKIGKLHVRFKTNYWLF